MGHWTTYRRRGSKPSAADVIPLPATPVLTFTTDVISTTAAGGNTGGTAEIYVSSTEFGAYTLDNTLPWATVVNFGTRASFSGLWLKTLNNGDGIHRSFRSAFSNALLA